jgi:hypothetical protein
LLWHGTAEGVIDLHPSGFDESVALTVRDNSQVGYGYWLDDPEPSHALLWRGTADSAVDLHPSGFESSQAVGVAGEYQVGLGTGPTTGNQQHALLWNGTSASAVDLNPAGSIESAAFSIYGTSTVGYALGAATGNRRHAMIWSNTAASAVDLHPFLDGLGRTLLDSTAARIAENGSIVGYAYDTEVGDYVAVMWTPVPEPLPLLLIICGAAITSLAGVRPRRA